MKAILALASILAMAVSVHSHATLVFPAPFGTPNSPSKTTPTGGGTTGTPVFPFTGNQYIDWKLIAGDGAGLMRMLINTNGGTFPAAGTPPADTLITVALTPVTTANCNAGTCATYGTANPANGPVAPSNNPYEFTFDVPAGINCQGSMGQFQNSVCTVQVSSGGGWYSGFAFSTAAAVGGATAAAGTVYQGTCENPDPAQLSTCAGILTGLAATQTTAKQIWVPQGTTQADMDASVLAEINQNLPNPNVFRINEQLPVQSISTPTPCTKSYTAFLCAQAFVPCNLPTANPRQPIGGSAGQPCGPTCDEFTCWCTLNAKHAFLYSCTSYSNAGRDSMGRCPVYKNIRGYGPNNSTCVPATTNTDGTLCPAGDICSGAQTGANASPIAFAVLAVAAAAAVYFH